MFQNVLTDKQWKLLYPLKKKHTTSQKYDSRTLVTLLETICHLCPPYPHGWSKEPLPKDGSLSADVLRLQLLFQELATYGMFYVDALARRYICKRCEAIYLFFRESNCSHKEETIRFIHIKSISERVENVVGKDKYNLSAVSNFSTTLFKNSFFHIV